MVNSDAVTIQLTVQAEPAKAFTAFVTELAGAWRRAAIEAAPRPSLGWNSYPDSPIVRGDAVVGRVTVWEPGHRLVLSWSGDDPAEAHVEFEPETEAEATTITLRLVGASTRLDPEPGVIGWFAERIAAPAVAAASPHGIDEALLDRRARWPEGPVAREVYSGSDRGPHGAMARVVLRTLDPGPDDVLLEVGCGAGVSLLAWSLARNARVIGLDHSATLLQVATEKNHAAISAGRLRLIEADAVRMPLEDGEVTRIGMIQVFFLLTDPQRVLAECHRVLRPGGVLASITGVEPEHRPPTDRKRIYAEQDDELHALARKAGFDDVSVTRNRYGGQLLVARKA